jgi:very-short-patch-repair endonuclease
MHLTSSSMHLDGRRRAMALPVQVTVLASKQHGCFDNAQAKQLGMTQDMLDNRRAAGEISSPCQRVYVIAGTPATWEQRLMIACLAGGSRSTVSHRSAASLWELLSVDDDVLEITTSRRRSARLDVLGVVQHRPLDLVPAQVTTRRGLPVTNPLRTMIDLCGVVDQEVAQEALDAGIGMRLFSIAAVDRMRRRLAKPGRTGTGRAKELLESQVILDDERTRLEAMMARLWRTHALPAYVFQHVVRDVSGRFVARPDFSIPELKIAFEVKGWRTHSTPQQVDADDRRTHKLLANGWIVMQFSWWRVKHEPAAVAAEIRAVLSVRSAAA